MAETLCSGVVIVAEAGGLGVRVGVGVVVVDAVVAVVFYSGSRQWKN